MKRSIIAFLTLASCLGYAGPLYVPATNGFGWNGTFAATSGYALNVRSNLLMGIGGGIFWNPNVDGISASLRHSPEIHGAAQGALQLNGDSDLVLSEGTFGSGFYGGRGQLGNHSNFGGDFYMAYASSGPSAGDVGHSKPLGFEAIYSNPSRVDSKFSLVGRPGTNVVSDGWANGYLELYDVPPVWNNGAFSSAPNQQPGRKLGRIGADGFVFSLAGAGFNGSYYTNRGSGGTLGHEWIATNNIPSEPALDGSIATVGNGASSALYQRVNGAWVEVGGSGDSLWTLDIGTGPGATDVLIPLVANDAYIIGTTSTDSHSFGVMATGGALNFYQDGDLQMSFNSGIADISSPTLNINGATLNWIGGAGGGTSLLQVDNAGAIARASTATLGGAINLGTTPSSYLTLQNTTDAAAGAQQVSPSILLSGQGWKTTATAASQQVDYRQYVLPVQGAANPTANWVLQSQINGGGYTDRMVVTSGGDVQAAGFVTTAGGRGIGLNTTPSGDPTIINSTLNVNLWPSSTGNVRVSRSGGPSAHVGGTIEVDTTQTGNVGAGEDTLQSFSVPASQLSVTGDFLKFRSAGTFGASVNSKRVRVKFGATTILDTGALGITGATSWVISGTITRTGATTQKCEAVMNTSSATLMGYAAYATATETLSGAVTFLVTGEATDNNDVVKETFQMEWMPNQ